MCVQVYSVLEKQIILDMCYLTESENITHSYNCKSATYDFHNFLDTSTSITVFFGWGAHDMFWPAWV